MREQWEPVEGGTPTLRLWSEDAHEEQLTVIERSLLETTLEEVAREHAELKDQVKLARCTCRYFTGYGAYLDLAVSDAAPRTDYANRIVSRASINWKHSDRADLLTVLFLKDRRLSTLEIVPSDAQGWSVAECRNILSADPSSVVIRPAI